MEFSYSLKSSIRHQKQNINTVSVVIQSQKSGIYFPIKRSLLIVGLWMAVALLIQSTVQGQSIKITEGLIDSSMRVGADMAANKLIIPTSADLSDTLGTKRGLFKTAVFKKGGKLTNADVILLLKDTQLAQKTFRRGNSLKPVAGLVAVTGLVVGYLGIKGTTETAMIRGVRTSTNRNVPDIQVDYIKRSLPKVLGGLGLVLGAVCLLEISNELTAKSVVLYNTKSVSQTSKSQVRTIKVGVTSSGLVGLEAHF